MSAKIHLIYYHLLHDSLYLSEDDFDAIKRDYPQAVREDVETALIRSSPGSALRGAKVTGDRRLLSIFEGLLLSLKMGWPYGIHQTARIFDYSLEYTPGFYYRTNDLEEINLDMVWRVNTPDSGLLKPYYDERARILGIFIYKHPTDTQPRLLSSAGLTLGAPARFPLATTRRSLL